MEKTGSEKMNLQLYISGMTENSIMAIQNITKLCDKYRGGDVGHIDLEVIDIYKNPAAASEQEIVFSPSLIRQTPLPKKILIGDLSNTQKVIHGLGIVFKE